MLLYLTNKDSNPRIISSNNEEIHLRNSDQHSTNKVDIKKRSINNYTLTRATTCSPGINYQVFFLLILNLIR